MTERTVMTCDGCKREITKEQARIVLQWTTETHHFHSPTCLLSFLDERGAVDDWAALKEREARRATGGLKWIKPTKDESIYGHKNRETFDVVSWLSNIEAAFVESLEIETPQDLQRFVTGKVETAMSDATYAGGLALALVKCALERADWHAIFESLHEGDKS